MQKSITEIVVFFLYIQGMQNQLVKNIYIQTNENYEKTTNKFFTNGNQIFLPLVIGPAFVGSYVKYFSTHDVESFELMFVAR